MKLVDIIKIVKLKMNFNLDEDSYERDPQYVINIVIELCNKYEQIYKDLINAMKITYSHIKDKCK